MNFKKKRSFRDIARAAVLLLVFPAVPTWLFVVCMITNNLWLWISLFLWFAVCWIIWRRFEDV